MGYERNDRRYGGYNSDRDRFGYDRGRATSYGQGSRDDRGDRFDSRDDDRRSAGDQDRGFFDRAGDEVRSWFGDDEAERRRRDDTRNDELHRSYGDDRYTRDYGYNDRANAGGRDYARGASSYAAGDASGWNNYDRNADRNRRADHDPHYRSWRDRQVEAFDRDYDDYRREHQSKFDDEFHSWRQGRQGQRALLTKVKEHQDVVGSDGEHVGKVDHVRGDTIQLAKNDSASGGHHHLIPSSWIQSVEDDKVTLSKTADQAKQHWRDDERNAGGGFFRDQDRSGNLNRSFSGTY
jgi:hypothetical protein